MRIAQHRHVAAVKIGRQLRAGEVVHHRNADPWDNRPSNLRVFPSRGAHTAHHHRRRSIRFLARYARFLAHATGLSFDDAVEAAYTTLYLPAAGRRSA